MTEIIISQSQNVQAQAQTQNQIHCSLLGVEYDYDRCSRITGLASTILKVLHRCRRAPEDEILSESINIEEAFEPQYKQLINKIENDEPIVFAIAAFPCKSSSPFKVASRLPDLGEFIGLHMLHILAEDISKIYSPGCSVVIASDGYVFTDVLRMTDELVTNYVDALKKYCSLKNLNKLSFYDLRDEYPELGDDMEARRRKVDEDFSTPREVLSKEKDENPDTMRSLRGMCRFLKEDVQGFAALNLLSPSELSQTARKKLALTLAYKVIDRSRSWGVLIKRRIPHCIRLSIHPQPIKCEKFGFQLLGKGGNSWTTPWHGVALFDSETEAEKMTSDNLNDKVRRIVRTNAAAANFSIVSAAYASLVGRPVKSDLFGNISHFIRVSADDKCADVHLVKSVIESPSNLVVPPYITNQTLNGEVFAPLVKESISRFASRTSESAAATRDNSSSEKAD